MSDLTVISLRSVEFSVAAWSWPFASERRAEIDAHFAALRERSPSIWNGRVLLSRDYVLNDGELRGASFETDFASFVAWRDWGAPDRTVANFFGMGAVRGSDGAFLLGVMGPHTINAGRIYFPAGTPDPSDVVGTKVDLAGSITREVAEEVGMTPDEYDVAPDWSAVISGSQLALIKTLHAHEPASQLRWHALSYLESEQQPELSGLRVVRGESDLDPMMPDFVVAFLRAQWQG